MNRTQNSVTLQTRMVSAHMQKPALRNAPWIPLLLPLFALLAVFPLKAASQTVLVEFGSSTSHYLNSTDPGCGLAWAADGTAGISLTMPVEPTLFYRIAPANPCDEGPM